MRDGTHVSDDTLGGMEKDSGQPYRSGDKEGDGSAQPDLAGILSSKFFGIIAHKVKQSRIN